MSDTRFISSLGACILALSLTLAACGGGGGSSDTGSGGVADKPIAPSITTPPASQSVVAGKTATFSVVATGSATLAYQWKKNGTDISGATSNTYTTPATSSADTGAIFSVSVSNSAGTVTSSNATLTVTDVAVAPSISTQPVSQSVAAGQSATFTVLAAGSETISYQWKKNGTDIPGATSNPYTTPETTIAEDGAQFSVVVTNSAGTATSTDARLAVTPGPGAPTITTQPSAPSVVAPQTASFSVVATGTEPMTYQWKKNDSNIDGATSSTYTTPATSLGDNKAIFTVEVRNSAGTATSNKAILTVTSAPVAPAISTQPVAQSVVAPQTASFSVVASGTDPLVYQWKKNGVNIDGATSSTYTTPATSLGDNGAMFSVEVRNSAGTATSSTATLAVSAVVITTQPVAQTVVATRTASFSVVATGTGTLTYQWAKNGNPISGAPNSSSYTTPATVIGDNGAQYSVVVSNGTSTVTSSPATLTVSDRYSLVTNGASTYTKAECVKDSITGLTWEGKNPAGSTSRLGTSTYTNYDGTGVGQKDIGVDASSADISAATNSIGYRDSVRTLNLCGYNDWRLPTTAELEGIVVSGTSPNIDTAWFPNTRTGFYWSSDANKIGNNSVGNVTSFNSSVYVGSTDEFRRTSYPVRLVRCGAVAPATCTSN